MARGNGYNFGGQKAEMLKQRMREIKRERRRKAEREKSNQTKGHPQ